MPAPVPSESDEWGTLITIVLAVVVCGGAVALAYWLGTEQSATRSVGHSVTCD